MDIDEAPPAIFAKPNEPLLQRLPSEIRQRIFSYILNDTTVNVCQEVCHITGLACSAGLHGCSLEQAIFVNPKLPLMLVCRQFYWDIKAIYKRQRWDLVFCSEACLLQTMASTRSRRTRKMVNKATFQVEGAPLLMRDMQGTLRHFGYYVTGNGIPGVILPHRWIYNVLDRENWPWCRRFEIRAIARDTEKEGSKKIDFYDLWRRFGCVPSQKVEFTYWMRRLK